MFHSFNKPYDPDHRKCMELLAVVVLAQNITEYLKPEKMKCIWLE